MVLLVPAAVTAAAGTAQATPASGDRAIAASGWGAGTPSTVNLAQMVAAAGAAGPAGTTDHAAAATGAPATRAAVRQALPPVVAPGRQGPPRPVPAGAGVRPALTTTVVANFDGNQQSGGFGWPDVTAAASPTEIAETTNTFLQVYSKTGAIQCNGGVTLNRFLRTSDFLTSPRILYDAGFSKFIMVVEVEPTTASAVPAIYLSISDTGEACGTWFSYRLTFHGDQFPGGTELDYPIVGMDTDALLISSINIRSGGAPSYTVFSVLKSQVYHGQTVSFPFFSVDGVTAPATASGFASTFPFSYFVNAVPGTGYRLYQMRNAGTLTVTFTLLATIPASFSAPSRFANQPGAPASIYAFDGRIQAAPVTDGSGIWFAHDIDSFGFPTVEYGRIDIASKTVATALAFHASTSDDFNPSIGIGINPAGGTYLYLNWAYTDSTNGVPVSNVVDTDLLPTGRPVLSSRVGTGVVTVTGTNFAGGTFGQYSSVALDPAAPSGSCAVTAQEYRFQATWRTRLVRVGTC